MKGIQTLTPARERHLRSLSSVSTQLHNHVLTLGDTIRLREDERRHAVANIEEAEKYLTWLKREEKFASGSKRESLDRDLTKAKKHLEQERGRAQSLADEIAELNQQTSAASDAWRRAAQLVDTVLKAFGPAGQGVDSRMRGQA